jgi:LytR cell envelope-related transcriptional attenuator
MLWEMLQTNTLWHGHLPTLPASSVDVTALNGTGTTGLAARTVARLRHLGFRVSAVGQAPRTSSATVSYQGPAQAGRAYTLMRALRLTPDSVQDGASGSLTLTLGSDFTGRVGIGQPQHAGRDRAHSRSTPTAGQQPVVPGQSAAIESRNAAENLCTGMPDADSATGGP